MSEFHSLFLELFLEFLLFLFGFRVQCVGHKLNAVFVFGQQNITGRRTIIRWGICFAACKGETNRGCAEVVREVFSRVVGEAKNWTASKLSARRGGGYRCERHVGCRRYTPSIGRRVPFSSSLPLSLENKNGSILLAFIFMFSIQLVAF